MSLGALHTKVEEGFVLATSLVLLTLLSILSIAVYFGTITAQQTSSAAELSTEAFYYAETGINYLSWALKNDAELDGNDPTPMPGLVPAPVFSTIGDRAEWSVNVGVPNAQLLYFDNRPLIDRVVSWPNSLTAPPVLSRIHTKLMNYIRLDIDNIGNISSTFMTAPHALVVGVDVPTNGAIIWLAGGNKDNDYEFSPFDRYDIYVNGNLNWPACGVATLESQVACGRSSVVGYKWLTTQQYGLVGYSIGYVNGKARKLIRAVIKL